MIAQFTTNLIAKNLIAQDTYQFIFNKPDGLEFIAGQYVFLDFAHPIHTDDRPSMRAMSIASAPQEESLMFIMRSSDSAFKKNIIQMNLGDEILVKGPIGHMALPANIHQSIVIIVAGMGITPARSMIKHEEILASPRPITLLYCNRTKETIALRHEIDNMALKNYTVIHTLTREEGEWNGEKGRVDASMIMRHIDDIPNQMYYVVGTGEFITSMQTVLEELTVEKIKIQFDNFG